MKYLGECGGRLFQLHSRVKADPQSGARWGAREGLNYTDILRYTATDLLQIEKADRSVTVFLFPQTKNARQA